MGVPTFLKNEQTGVVYLNPLKKFVKPFWLTPQDVNNTGNLTVGALASSPMILRNDQQGPFEGFYATVQHNGDMLVRIQDTGMQRDLMNRDCHLDTIFAPAPGGQSPFIFPETLWMDAGSTLLLTFTDASGVIQAVRPVIHGRKFYLRSAPRGIGNNVLSRRERERRVSTPYWYTTDQAMALAAGQTGLQIPLTVSQEGHFEARKITCVASGPFNFKISENRNGINMAGNTFVSNVSCTGIASFPYIFPESWLIERNTQLTIEFNNVFPGPNTIFFTISGRRIYDEQYSSIQ